jgi:hypothetical protein
MGAGIDLCHGDTVLDLVGDPAFAVIAPETLFVATLKRRIPGLFMARAHRIVVAPP